MFLLSDQIRDSLKARLMPDRCTKFISDRVDLHTQRVIQRNKATKRGCN